MFHFYIIRLARVQLGSGGIVPVGGVGSIYPLYPPPQVTIFTFSALDLFLCKCRFFVCLFSSFSLDESYIETCVVPDFFTTVTLMAAV